MVILNFCNSIVCAFDYTEESIGRVKTAIESCTPSADLTLLPSTIIVVPTTTNRLKHQSFSPGNIFRGVLCVVRLIHRPSWRSHGYCFFVTSVLDTSLNRETVDTSITISIFSFYILTLALDSVSHPTHLLLKQSPRIACRLHLWDLWASATHRTCYVLRM
jgi:hypothetical protein